MIMRPRIKTQKHRVLVYTASQDKEKQTLAKFNRDKYLKSSDISYIDFKFDRAHKNTKSEYEDRIALGLKCKMITL